jgi:cytochrome bd-type quinol oxidase subunit 2
MLVELGRMHGTHRNQTSFLHTLIRPCLVFLCTSLWSRHDPKVSQEKWLQHIPRYLFAPTADLTFYVLIKFSPWIGRKRLGWVAAAVLLLPFTAHLIIFFAIFQFFLCPNTAVCTYSSVEYSHISIVIGLPWTISVKPRIEQLPALCIVG